MKKFFSGVYPFPRIFEGHFTCKSKKIEYFLIDERDAKIQNRPIPNRGQGIER
jgi:hypothetical protein